MHVSWTLPFTLFAIANVHGQAPPPPVDLIAFIQADPELTVLKSLLPITGKDYNDYINKAAKTFFAPTDAAFKSLDASSPEGIAIATKESRGIVSILGYLSSDATIPIVNLGSGQYYGTLLSPGNTIGDELSGPVAGNQFIGVLRKDNKIVVKSGLGKFSTILGQGIVVGSTTIYKVDSVPTLPALLSETTKFLGLNSFSLLLNATNLTNPFDYAPQSTLFVPTDAAIKATFPAPKSLPLDRLKALLKNHISIERPVFTTTLNGPPVTVTTWAQNSLSLGSRAGGPVVAGAPISIPDVIVANGVAQIIDQ